MNNLAKMVLICLTSRFPIGIVGVAARQGVAVSGEVNVAMAILVILSALPLSYNSLISV